MIQFIEKGDIFNIAGVNNYAHGCNCAGAMGKGIALQFKNKYPKMYSEYRVMCKDDYNYGNGHIYNLGTQVSWKTKARLEYVENSVGRMLELASSDNVTKIALPAIGAGFGGLNWNDVKEILIMVSVNYPDIELYVVEAYG